MAKNRMDFIKENEMETVQGRDTFLSLAKQIQTNISCHGSTRSPKKT